MLEVCLELCFPVSPLSRSPLVLRDLDVLSEINQRTRAAVVFSVISAPGSPGHERARLMEGLAPPAEKRFSAMEQIARTSILTGVCFMPILPGICDDDANLTNVVRWTADHGRRFVLAGGLTLADQQREYFLGVLREHAPDLLPLYERLYPPGSYAPVSGPWRAVPRRIRVLNKRVVEALTNRCYSLELDNAPGQRAWAYRKAAWAIEDLEQDVSLVYRRMGLKGLQSVQGVEPALAGEVERLIGALDRPAGSETP